MDDAFTYVQKNKLETEADYPYQGTDNKCAYDAAKGKVGVSGFSDVPQNSTA
jgi:hypothetical protein